MKYLFIYFLIHADMQTTQTDKSNNIKNTQT